MRTWIVLLAAWTAMYPVTVWAAEACGPGDSVIGRILSVGGGTGAGGAGGSAGASAGFGSGGGTPASADSTGRVWAGAMSVESVDEGLYGKVFEDLNKDGWPNKGERGIPGVRVFTDTDKEARTNESGDYMMKALETGERMVKVDETTVPKSYQFTTPSSVRVRVNGGVKSRVSFGMNPSHSEFLEKTI